MPNKRMSNSKTCGAVNRNQNNTCKVCDYISKNMKKKLHTQVPINTDGISEEEKQKAEALKLLPRALRDPLKFQNPMITIDKRSEEQRNKPKFVYTPPQILQTVDASRKSLTQTTTYSKDESSPEVTRTDPSSERTSSRSSEKKEDDSYMMHNFLEDVEKKGHRTVMRELSLAKQKSLLMERLQVGERQLIRNHSEDKYCEIEQTLCDLATLCGSKAKGMPTNAGNIASIDLHKIHSKSNDNEGLDIDATMRRDSRLSLRNSLLKKQKNNNAPSEDSDINETDSEKHEIHYRYRIPEEKYSSEIPKISLENKLTYLMFLLQDERHNEIRKQFENILDTFITSSVLLNERNQLSSVSNRKDGENINLARKLHLQQQKHTNSMRIPTQSYHTCSPGAEKLIRVQVQTTRSSDSRNAIQVDQFLSRMKESAKFAYTSLHNKSQINRFDTHMYTVPNDEEYAQEIREETCQEQQQLSGMGDSFDQNQHADSDIHVCVVNRSAVHSKPAHSPSQGSMYIAQKNTIKTADAMATQRREDDRITVTNTSNHSSDDCQARPQSSTSTAAAGRALPAGRKLSLPKMQCYRRRPRPETPVKKELQQTETTSPEASTCPGGKTLVMDYPTVNKLHKKTMHAVAVQEYSPQVPKNYFQVHSDNVATCVISSTDSLQRSRAKTITEQEIRKPLQCQNLDGMSATERQRHVYMLMNSPQTSGRSHRPIKKLLSHSIGHLKQPLQQLWSSGKSYLKQNLIMSKNKAIPLEFCGTANNANSEASITNSLRQQIPKVSVHQEQETQLKRPLLLLTNRIATTVMFVKNNSINRKL